MQLLGEVCTAKKTLEEKYSTLSRELKAVKQQLSTVVRRVRRAQEDPDPNCTSAKVAALMVGERGGVEELATLVKCLGNIDPSSLGESKQTAYEFAKNILKNLFVLVRKGGDIVKERKLC